MSYAIPHTAQGDSQQRVKKLTTSPHHNPITNARVLQDAQSELQADLLENAHGIVKALLELDPCDHDRLGNYKHTLLPLISQYLQHARAFDMLETSMPDSHTALQHPLLTLTKQLDTLALDVLAVITSSPQEAR